MTANESNVIAAASVLMPLDEAAGRPEIAGAKAASLGHLIAAGFRTPGGYVLTTDAFRDSSAATLPPHVDEAIDRLAAEFGDRPLAVRSSATAEDLPTASFAGQYTTVLDVRGGEALREAIRTCWASLGEAHAATYTDRAGIAGEVAMAVVVQQLVDARAAGVAFTANPVTGARDEVVINAVSGLGERLVSGMASPDEWIVRGDEASCEAAIENAIDAEQAVAIASLARRVEAHFGTPQDIEWAIDAADEVVLLQARPITTALAEPPVPAEAGAEIIEQVPVPVDVPPGYWVREASHSPLPVTPLSQSFMMDRRNQALREAFAAFGILASGVELRSIGGYDYQRLVPLDSKDRAAPPKPVFWLLARTMPSLRKRIAVCKAAIRNDLAGTYIRRWHEEWNPRLERQIAALRADDLPSLSDAALLDHWSRVQRLSDEGVDIHFMLHVPIGISLADLAFTSRDLLGWAESEIYTLLDGCSPQSTAPAARLSSLARMVSERPTLKELFEDLGSVLPRVREVDAEFADAFDAYQRDFGARALRYDTVDPTLAEVPEVTLAQIRDLSRSGYDLAARTAEADQRREAMLADARAALVSRPASDQVRWERAMRRALDAYPLREEQEHNTISVPLALVRYAALEFGRRLAERGQFSAAMDAFWLTRDELPEALRSGSDQRPLVLRRKGERAWIDAHPGPLSYGTEPGAPPDFSALPKEARFLMEAVLWTTDRIFGAAKPADVRDTRHGIQGTPAARGRYTGTVRIVRGEHEFGKIEPGDVLVCPITSPVWSVLFASVGALVTDTGGTLSHPAIIAREYGIPAVVATGNATAVLRDGQRVTVDGSAGTVEVVD